MTDYERSVTRQKVAERIFNYIAPWDRDYETIDDIANDIENDPEAVIDYLMDLLEEAMN
jgi:hypothetical protein